MNREQLIIHKINKWKPLIRHLANIYQNQICGFEDLCSVGRMQIIICIDKYDSKLGELDSFICTCIYNAIKTKYIG